MHRKSVALFFSFLSACSISANDCGVRKTFKQHTATRRPAKENEFPWTVALVLNNGNEYKYFCTATMISDRWIITAAHCVQRRDISQIRAIFGTTDYTKKQRNGFISSIAKVVTHKSFRNKTVGKSVGVNVFFSYTVFQDDIALLKTTQKIPSYSQNENINRICLPKHYQEFNGIFYNSGWGRIAEVNNETSELKMFRIDNLYDSYDCGVYHGQHFDYINMFCGNSLYGKSEEDLCKGDAGSPLEKIIENKSYLVGILSSGPMCYHYPTIYTKISSNVNWIKSVIGEKVEHGVFPQPPTRDLNVNLVGNDCGKRMSNFYRIVGGRPAAEKEFPWTIALEERGHNDNLYDHFCGAAVISDRWIITAAHCLHRKNVKLLRAVMGTIDLTKANESFSTTFEKAVVHPGFNYTSYENDIALLKTTQKIPNYSTNRNINKICLPENEKEYFGHAEVSGWGFDDEEGYTSDHLKVLQINLYDDTDCISFYENRFNSARMICAGYVKGKRDACKGDSGGPLETRIGDRSYLVGIVSFGDGCARANFPGVYTQVSKYVTWILETMNENDTHIITSSTRKKSSKKHGSPV